MSIDSLNIYLSQFLTRYRNRQIAYYLGKFTKEFNNDDDPSSYAKSMADKFIRIAEASTEKESSVTLTEINDDLVNKSGIVSKVITTGISRIDRTVEVDKSTFMIIAARPAVGKTTLALNIALNMAKNNHNRYGGFASGP